MDDTTPPVTKIYLVSLIYTPKESTNATTFTTSGKREGNPAAVRRGIIPSRKPLLRHTCMDLYHTTYCVRMQPKMPSATPHDRYLPANEAIRIVTSPPC